MEKIISSTLIIALLVGLCLHGSITVDAASDITELESEYPYIYWIPTEQCLIVSKLDITPMTMSSSNGILIRNPSDNTWIQTETFDYYYLQLLSYTLGDCYRLFYNQVTGWEAEQPDRLRSGLTSGTVYYSAYGTSTSGLTVYTNGDTIGSPFTSGGTTLPDDIPPLDNVEDAINDALNATTSATTEANTIQTNIYNTYNSYSIGEITEAEFNTAMAEYQTQLEELANRTTNTLADNVAINNAITYQDLIINQQVNNISQDLITLIDNWRINLNKFFTEFNTGTTTQEITLKKLNTLNFQINQAFTTGNFTSTADLNALNAMQQAVNNTITSVTNYSDLDAEVSESAKASMESEMAFVDSLLAETTQSLEQLTPQLTDSESTQALQWVGMIWENKFFKMVLPWCGIAMLLCLVLGVKYKT